MNIHHIGQAPQQQHMGDAGYDLLAAYDAVVRPGQWESIGTGLRVVIPFGFAGLVCSRSGLAAKAGVFVLNAPGVIDAGYRGEIKVVLANIGVEELQVHKGDRIAQLLITPIVYPQWAPVDSMILSDSTRGDNGFGSTGMLT